MQLKISFYCSKCSAQKFHIIQIWAPAYISITADWPRNSQIIVSTVLDQVSILDFRLEVCAILGSLYFEWETCYKWCLFFWFVFISIYISLFAYKYDPPKQDLHVMNNKFVLTIASITILNYYQVALTVLAIEWIVSNDKLESGSIFQV